MRKLLGVAATLFSLFSAALVVSAVTDLLTGGNPGTERGVLVGLVVFFGGLAVTSGFGAWRMLATRGVAARVGTAPDLAQQTDGIDIDLEARVLEQAASSGGRLTVPEVAVGCAVSLEQAERALDGLAGRGHADLHITNDGDRVYVLRGFLSAEQKEAARDVVEATRGLHP